jgi:hypothetical protein
VSQGTSDLRHDREAFAIVHVHSAEIRDLDFASDASRHLRTFARKLQSGFAEEVRQGDVMMTWPLCATETLE